LAARLDENNSDLFIKNLKEFKEFNMVVENIKEQHYQLSTQKAGTSDAFSTALVPAKAGIEPSKPGKPKAFENNGNKDMQFLQPIGQD
jgi:hypothetical protein